MQYIDELALVLIMASLLCANGCLGAGQRVKLQELGQLAANTPKFPDFEQVNYADIIKSDGAIVTYFYRSSASYEEVKNFYSKELTSRGWSGPHEESVAHWLTRIGSQISFRKAQYKINIVYDNTGSKWRFAVDYVWESK
jgi:hypothetical protein